MAIHHKGGGIITRLTALGHDTYKGVAHWFFVGDVQWSDGSCSQGVEIAPYAVCADEGTADAERIESLMQRLNDYLLQVGDWHEPRHKRDGRVYSWSPGVTAGRWLI